MGMLSDLFRGVAAAVPGAAAARGGYLQGQQQGRRQRAEDDRIAREDKRRTLLDETRLAMEKQQLVNSERTAKAAEARANDEELGVIDRPEGTYYYGKRSGKTRRATTEDGTPVPGKPDTSAPRTVNAADGIREWDPKTRTWKKTGMAPYHAPRAGEGTDKATDKAFDKTKAAYGAVRGQINDTQRKLNAQEESDNERFMSTGADADTTRAHGLRTQLDSLGRVSDSLSGELQRQARGGAAAKPKQVITANQAKWLREHGDKSGKKWTDAEIAARYTVAP